MHFTTHRKILNGAKATVLESEQCYIQAIADGAAAETRATYAECYAAACEDLRSVRSTPLRAIAAKAGAICLS